MPKHTNVNAPDYYLVPARIMTRTVVGLQSVIVRINTLGVNGFH